LTIDPKALYKLDGDNLLFTRLQASVQFTSVHLRWQQ
jgi:hypothetical protein